MKNSVSGSSNIAVSHHSILFPSFPSFHPFPIIPSSSFHPHHSSSFHPRHSSSFRILIIPIIPSFCPHHLAMQGKIGTAKLPGSTHVLDRSTDTLVECDPERCPFARMETTYDGLQRLVNRAPNFGIGGESASADVHEQLHMHGSCMQQCMQRCSASQFCHGTDNYVAQNSPNKHRRFDCAFTTLPLPLCLYDAGITGMVNALHDPAFKQSTYELFSFLASPSWSRHELLSGLLMGPFRYSHFDVSNASLAEWGAAGYIEEDVKEFLLARCG
eukprot:352483-Chlamydomonas_euryale.AAC.4